MPQLNTHDLILQLKDIKKDHGLTAQMIYDITKASGSQVSLNSIKRIFEEGSENKNFRNDDTLQPVARILIAVFGNNQNQEIGILQAELEAKTKLIAHLEHQLKLKDDRMDKFMDRVDVLIGLIQQLLNRCERCRMGAGEWHIIGGKTDCMKQSE